MYPEQDIKFTTQREAAERAAAEAAADPIARGIHTDLADRYARRSRPLDMSAAQGQVTISNASGTVASLSPREAMDSADLLMAKGREAARFKRK